MTDVTCKTCPFFGPGIDGLSWCHHSSAKIPSDADVELSPDWWCSKHPLAPGQRDRIAEVAMQGLLASDCTEPGGIYTAQQISKISYDIADAMMAERAKGKTHGLA